MQLHAGKRHDLLLQTEEGCSRIMRNAAPLCVTLSVRAFVRTQHSIAASSSELFFRNSAISGKTLAS